jgi:hypothetical protein
MDREFKKIKDLMPQLECNTTAAKEHVSKAAHMIRTIKERTRGLIGTLPFDNIPRQIKVEFIYSSSSGSMLSQQGMGSQPSTCRENCLCGGAWIMPNIVGCYPGLIVKSMMSHRL